MIRLYGSTIWSSSAFPDRANSLQQSSTLASTGGTGMVALANSTRIVLMLSVPWTHSLQHTCSARNHAERHASCSRVCRSRR